MSVIWESSHRRQETILGAYEFIEEQIEMLGEEYVEAMFDKGFEPAYIPGKGWCWLQVTESTGILH